MVSPTEYPNNEIFPCVFLQPYKKSFLIKKKVCLNDLYIEYVLDSKFLIEIGSLVWTLN